MLAHVEIRIRLNLDKAQTLHGVLRLFARDTPGWKWAPKQSKDYQSFHKGSAGFVISDSIKDLERGAVAIANVQPKHPHSFRVTNIVPQDCSSLTMDQYNSIGTRFAADFRTFLREGTAKGTVSVTGPKLGLAEIIPGARCRHFFECWLQTPTPTGHPSDIYALDRFICALSRYGSNVNLDRLARHLVEDRRWKSDSAIWTIRRIRAGLDILQVDRRF